MRVLVTGAAGFIGSHATRALLDDGHDVVGLDDLSTGRVENLPTSSRHWRFIRGDIRNAEVCSAAMDGASAVVHLAAQTSVPRSIEAPHTAVDVNIVGGVTLLETARIHGVDRFLYASSSSVYGEGPAIPQRESQRCHPLSPYAASKASFEQLAHAWTKCWGLYTVGLRFFNVFGPRQKLDTAHAAVVPRFIHSAMNRERPVIHGDGCQTRDFTYVDNAVHAIRLALDASVTGAGAVVNIGSGGRVSVLELWRVISGLLGFETSPHFEPARVGDMQHTQADLGDAKRLMDFEPIVSFEEGIERTVAWFRSERSGQDAGNGGR